MGGSVFSVQPTDPKDIIKKGWSGSVVLDDDGLLGIVIEVDEASNEAYAVRADVIRALINAARPGSTSAEKATSLEAPVVQLVGSTPDPAHGPSDIYQEGNSGWNAVPEKGRIAFMVVFDKPIHLKGVALGFSSAQNTLSGMDVAVVAASNSDAWASLNYCPFPNGDVSIRCSVVVSTVSKVRVTLKTANDSTIVLSLLNILHD